MGFVFDIKPAFVYLLKPFVGKLKEWRLNPYHMKAASFIGSVLVGLFLVRFALNGAWLLVVPWWLLFRAALNTFDTLLTEELGFKGTRFAFIDELGDVLSDVALFLPLSMAIPWSSLAVIIFVVAFVMVEFCGVMAMALGASRRQDGPVTKGSRAYFLGALALACSIKPVWVLQWWWIFYAATALCVWTCVNRILGAEKELGK